MKYDYRQKKIQPWPWLYPFDSHVIVSRKEKLEMRIEGDVEKSEWEVELSNVNKELIFQSEENSEQAEELIIANKKLAFQSGEKADRAAELIIANKELAFQIREKADRAAELIIANKEFAFQSGEKADLAVELILANKELAFQSSVKADLAVELIIANKKLAFQIREKADRAAELIIANKELAFQSGEKADRAAELIIASKELVFQGEEKEKRASELIIANKKLAFQNDEKKKRAAELSIANKELAFQNDEKADRAAELIIADKELAYQNDEKADRAAELIIANKELAFQSGEKADRAAELVIANKELTYQNEEKGKRAAELIIANKMLGKQAAELIIANKRQGEFFVNLSHELKTPLNVINSAVQLLQMYCNSSSLDEKKDSITNYIESAKQNCYRLSKLINNIVDLSKIEAGFFKLNLSNNNIVEIVENLVTSVTAFTDSKDLSIVFDTNTEEKIIACDSEKVERIVLNLISNAIKFSDEGDEIFVQVKDRNEYVEILVKDNGIGIEKKDLDIIFDRFKQVDTSLSRNSEGTGIGLSLVKSIAELHGGSINVKSEVGKGSKFTIMLPSKNVSHENMLYNSNMKNSNDSIQIELSDVYL